MKLRYSNGNVIDIPFSKNENSKMDTTTSYIDVISHDYFTKDYKLLKKRIHHFYCLEKIRQFLEEQIIESECEYAYSSYFGGLGIRDAALINQNIEWIYLNEFDKRLIPYLVYNFSSATVQSRNVFEMTQEDVDITCGDVTVLDPPIFTCKDTTFHEFIKKVFNSKARYIVICSDFSYNYIKRGGVAKEVYAELFGEKFDTLEEFIQCQRRFMKRKFGRNAIKCFVTLNCFMWLFGNESDGDEFEITDTSKEDVVEEVKVDLEEKQFDCSLFED